jgi:hypothetical protein
LSLKSGWIATVVEDEDTNEILVWL